MTNLYPEIIPAEGKEAAFLQRCPGLRWLVTAGEGPVRGMWEYGDKLYVVSGVGFYRLDPVVPLDDSGLVAQYTATWLGMVSGTGPVSMADNGTQLFIAANGPSWIWNAKTLQFKKIIDVDFPGAVTVGFIDGYFVFNEPNSQRIWVTSLYDGTSIDPLDFASAEANPDNVVALIVDHNEIWVFGTQTIEVWTDIGNTDFPFQRIPGAYNEIGIGATYSVAKADNRLFWMGADARGRGVIYAATGYHGQRVSTHAVEWQIQSYGDISDAVAYTYQQDGHTFYVISFPGANSGRGATWVYDVATNSWHERAGWVDGQFGRHRSNCQVAFNDQVLVGDYENGRVYKFDLDAYSDDTEVQVWLRSWRALEQGKNNLKRTAHHNLQLDCETGTKAGDILTAFIGVLATEMQEILLTEDEAHSLLVNEELRIRTAGPTDPQVMLRWSDDGGHTWSNEHWRSMGRVGEYGFRTIWRRLGMTVKLRDRVYEVSGSDPLKIAVMGAELFATGTTGSP